MLIVILSFNRSFCQVSKGLDFKIDYDQMIKDAKENKENLNKAYYQRYTAVIQAYKNALEVNSYSPSPKPSPTNGWYTCLATNGSDFCTNMSAFVENGVVTKTKPINGGKEDIVSGGGKIIEFKTVATILIATDKNVRFELYFNISLQ